MTKSAEAPPDNNLPSIPTSPRKYSAAAILLGAAAASSTATSSTATSTSAEDQRDRDNILNYKNKNPSLPSESSARLAYRKDLLLSSSLHRKGGTDVSAVINNNNQRTGLSKSNSAGDLSSSSKQAVLRAQRILNNFKSSSFRIRGKLADKTTSTSQNVLDQSLLHGLDISGFADQGLDFRTSKSNDRDPGHDKDVKANRKIASSSSRQLQKKTSTRNRSPRRVPSKSVAANKEEEYPPPTSSIKRTSSDNHAPRPTSPISGRGLSPRKSQSLSNLFPRRAPSKSQHPSEDDTESPPPKHKLLASSDHIRTDNKTTRTRSRQSSLSRRGGLEASSRHQTKRVSKDVTKLSSSSTHHHSGGTEMRASASSQHQHHRRPRRHHSQHHHQRHHEHEHEHHHGAVKKSQSTSVAAKRSSSLSPARYNSSTHEAKKSDTVSPKRISNSRTKGTHRPTKHENDAASPKRISSRATRKHNSNHKAKKMDDEQEQSNQPQPQLGNDMQDFSASVGIDDEEENENKNDMEHNKSNKNDDDDNYDDMKDFSSTVDIDTQSENSYCSECENGDSYSSDSKDEKNGNETRLSPRRRAAANTKRATSHRGRVSDSRGADAASDARPSRRRRDGTGKCSTDELGYGSGSKIIESRRRRAERRAANENSPVRKISGADRTTSNNAGMAGRRCHHGRVRNTTSNTMARAAQLERNRLARAVESSDPAATLALIAGYDREDDLQQPSEEFDDNNNEALNPPPLTRASSAGFLRSVASTTAKTGLNVASTVASRTGLTTVASTVASTTVAKTGLNVASTVASTTATTGLKALTAATSVATRALKQGKGFIHGEGAFHKMVEGVAPGQNLAKYIKELESGAIDNVNNSWKELQKHRNYAESAGILLFTHLFESCPSAKGVFGFPADADPGNVRHNPALIKHAAYLFKMIEKAIGLLTDKGPASLELQTILFDLGKKHRRMGVDQSYYPFMGQSLVKALREILGRRSFTASIEKSWVLVFNVLATEMCHGMNTDEIVVATWAQLKKVPYYKQKAGLLIFQHLFQTCPESKAVFGFGSDFKTDMHSLKESMHCRMHAEYFIMIFDKVMTMVETHSVDKYMRDLGQKHVRNGIKEEYFPVVGVGLIHALEVLLKQDFNDETREAWISAYARLSSRMIAEMRRASLTQ